MLPFGVINALTSVVGFAHARCDVGPAVKGLLAMVLFAPPAPLNENRRLLFGGPLDTMCVIRADLLTADP